MKNVNHKITFDNGKVIEVEASIVSKNRYLDSVDWLYFETLETDDVLVKGAKAYHRWTFDDGILTGWLVPYDKVLNIHKVLN